MRWTRVVTVTMLVTASSTIQVRAENVSDNPQGLLQPIMSISHGRPMTASVARRVVAAVRSSGATGTVVSFPTLALTRHSRDGVDILRLASGWRIPMATMVAPLEYLRAVAGDEMAEAASIGNVLMGETAASIRRAQVGDTLQVRDEKFRPRQYRISAIVPDSFVDWGELFITSESALPLGTLPLSRVDVTNIESPTKVVRALRQKKIDVGGDFRLRTSWDLVNPDGTLGTANTKKLLGEFAFRPTTGSSIMVSSKWMSANIEWSRKYSSVSLQNNCHRLVAAAIQGALTDIKKAGLASKINVSNSNESGGCFVGRYNRLGGTFGAPSRHAWGSALDINTNTNPQGREPHMNCDVVRIFRKWGFAWGGNFWPADGMHFEYVGKRRDRIGYPSRYCPNDVDVPAIKLPKFAATGTTTTTSTSTTVPS